MNHETSVSQEETRQFLLSDQLLVILGTLEDLGRPEILERPLRYLEFLSRAGVKLPRTMEYSKLKDRPERDYYFSFALFGLIRSKLIEIDRVDQEEDQPFSDFNSNNFNFRLTDKGRKQISELTKEYPDEVDWLRKEMERLGPNAPESIPRPTAIRAAYEFYVRNISKESE